MNDPHLAATMGENGNKWVRENLDVKKMTDNYIDLYTKLINKKSGADIKAPVVFNP